MKDIVDKLEERRDSARGGGEERDRRPARRGKLTARERIELLLDPNSFEEFDMFVEHRGTDFGTEKTPSRRRRGNRLGHHQRPHGLRVRQGFYRVRRVDVGSPCQKIVKIQEMAMQNGAPIIGLFDSGGARIQEGVARWRLWRSVQAQCARLRRRAADFRDHGAVRRRRCLFAGDDRLHLHGARHVLHVHHWPRRREDRDA